MDQTLDMVTRPALSAEEVLDAADMAVQRHTGAREQSDDIAPG